MKPNELFEVDDNLLFPFVYNQHASLIVYNAG